MARLISLYEWAIEEFGNAAPGKATLCRYAKFDMIYPPAIKVGWHWMVEKDARFVGSNKPKISPTDHPLLKKILMDGHND